MLMIFFLHKPRLKMVDELLGKLVRARQPFLCVQYIQQTSRKRVLLAVVKNSSAQVELFKRLMYKARVKRSSRLEQLDSCKLNSFYIWKNWYIFQLYYSHTLITFTFVLTMWYLTIMGSIYILHKHGLWWVIRWRHTNVLWRSRFLLLGLLLFWLWFLWRVYAKLHLQTDDTIVVLPAKWNQGIDNDKGKHYIDRFAHQVDVVMLWITIENEQPWVDETGMSKEIQAKVEEIWTHKSCCKENHVTFNKEEKNRA